jgi:hypothetical protein
MINHFFTHSCFASFAFFITPTSSLWIGFDCIIPLFRIEANNRFGARPAFTMCLNDFLIASSKVGIMESLVLESREIDEI